MQPLLQWKCNKYYIFLGCVCSFRYQHVMCMCHIAICGLTGSTITARFSEQVIQDKMCFLFSLQLLPQAIFILRRNERGVMINVYWFSRKVPAMLVIFELNLNFRDIFSKKHSNIKFHENSSYGGPSCSMRMDGETDMTKLTVVFRNFATRPQNSDFCPTQH